MLEAANEIAKEYAHLIQFLMMLAVTGATIISLWTSRQAYLDKQVCIDFVCDKSVRLEPVSALPQGGMNYKPSHDIISATITNTGLRDTAIPWLGFVLSVPRANKKAILQPGTNFMQQGKLDLKIGDRKVIELRSADQFTQEILNFDLKWFPRKRLRHLKLTLSTPTGDVFRAKIDKGLRRHINLAAKHTALIYQRTSIDNQAQSSSPAIT